MHILSKGEKIMAGPAPAEANPFRRAVFVVPILRDWLPLPLISEVNPATHWAAKGFELSPLYIFYLRGVKIGR